MNKSSDEQHTDGSDSFLKKLLRYKEFIASAVAALQWLIASLNPRILTFFLPLDEPAAVYSIYFSTLTCIAFAVFFIRRYRQRRQVHYRIGIYLLLGAIAVALFLRIVAGFLTRNPPVGTVAVLWESIFIASAIAFVTLAFSASLRIILEMILWLEPDA